ncbi:DUF349 domain-containing protein [Larkinella terrae]|uniref:DUF349 domain-containing protein n=1 Tax=Larkinella terrae TaxID=2025311 RepID=A0A7K0EH43_9BACT|nr:DUF349 domain-containing protein [Larkinella terrae]MRS61075.1 DUF349 domain-containing protein [Larkinella terrae]
MEQAQLVDEYGYVKDGKVFLSSYLSYPDRQIGEVKRTEQEALDYFKNRFTIAENKVNQLEQEVTDAQNKGSYLTKLVQLRKKLLSFDAIGNFIPLLNRLDEQEEILVELIRTNQLKNLEIKHALLAEAEMVADSTEWRETAEKLQEIKLKWIKTGPVDKELDETIETRFSETLDNFFQRRREFFNEQNKVIQERMDRYDNLIWQAERAVRSIYEADRSRPFKRDNLEGEALERANLAEERYMKALTEAYHLIRNLNNEWKEVGEVPIKKSGKILKKYRRATKTIFDRYNLARGIQPKVRIDPRVEQQMKMADEAEKLAKQSNIPAAADRAKELLNQWKEIKIPFKLVDKAVSERFRSSCDKIFELNYLERVISRKYPAFELKSRSEQLRTKVRELEYLVRREKSDLAMSMSSMDTLGRPGNEDADKMMMSKVNTQKRKIAMKEQILTEFNKELNQY